MLADRLLELYPAEHEVVFYCASVYPIAEPVIERIRLGDMRALETAPGPTLYIPPLPRASGRPYGGRAPRPQADVTSAPRKARAHSAADEVRLALVERERLLDARPRLLQTPGGAQDVAEIEQRVAVEVEEVGLLDGRQRLSGDGLRLGHAAPSRRGRARG